MSRLSLNSISFYIFLSIGLNSFSEHKFGLEQFHVWISFFVSLYQVCAKSVLNFAKVYNADYKGEFAHADADFH